MKCLDTSISKRNLSCTILPTSCYKEVTTTSSRVPTSPTRLTFPTLKSDRSIPAIHHPKPTKQKHIISQCSLLCTLPHFMQPVPCPFAPSLILPGDCKPPSALWRHCQPSSIWDRSHGNLSLVNSPSSHHYIFLCNLQCYVMCMHHGTLG